MLTRSALSALSPAGQNAKLSILIFHRVLPEPDPLFPDEPCVQRFDQMMGWISQWFNVLPLGEAIDRLKNSQLPARAAAITFDDGYADNFTCALPILQKHGLHATFFVATGFLGKGIMWNDVLIESIRRSPISTIDAGFLGLGILAINTSDQQRRAISLMIPTIKHLPPDERKNIVERVHTICTAPDMPEQMMTERQLIDLKNAGMSIGAHTVTHPILAKLDDNSAKEEIANGRDFLEQLLKQKIEFFAYPNGKQQTDYSERTTQIVKSLGFTASVSTNWGAASADSDLFQLPRFTPWDRTRLRYAFRMIRNLRH